MRAIEFRDMIAADPDLELVACDGETLAEAVVTIRFNPLGSGHQIAMREIFKADRKALLAVLRFERPSRIFRRVDWDGRRGGRPSRHSAVARLSLFAA